MVGTQLEADTDHEGRFVITLVPFGSYTLRSPRSRTRSRAITVGRGYEHRGHRVRPDRAGALPERLEPGARVEDLALEIRPYRSSYKYGDSPRFEVRIWNRGTKPVVLVKCVPASDAGASPRGEWKVAAPFSGYEHVRGGVTIDPQQGVGSADFVEVAPGESFDPYMDGWVPNALADGAVTRPGRYTVTFRYATTDRNPRAWVRSGRRDFAGRARALARVPVVELTAKTDINRLLALCFPLRVLEHAQLLSASRTPMSSPDSPPGAERSRSRPCRRWSSRAGEVRRVPGVELGLGGGDLEPPGHASECSSGVSPYSSEPIMSVTFAPG